MNLHSSGMLVAWAAYPRRYLRATVTPTSLTRSSASGPDLLFVPGPQHSDRPALGRAHRCGPPSPAGVFQPADSDRPPSGAAAPITCRSTITLRCSRGPTGLSPCLTPSRANPCRSSRMREPRCRSCCWPPAIPIACVLWCSGTPIARFSGRRLPLRHSRARFAGLHRELCEALGTGAMVDISAPSWAGDAAKRRWWARSERLAGGPRLLQKGAELFMRTDVRPVLESIQAPTLICAGAATARSVAARPHSPRADTACAAGGVRRRRSLWFAGDADRRAGRDRVVPHRRAPRQAVEPRVVDRLFTDIVGSTAARNAARRRGVGDNPRRP